MKQLWQCWSHLTLLVALGLSFPTQAAWGFSDTSDRWESQCIDRLFDRGLVSGYPDGTFRPNATVTRTEFAVLMLNTFPNMPRVRGSAYFKDVESSYWGYNAIQEASARAFFAGYPDGTFKPQQAIPRVQAMAVVANALSLIVPDDPTTILEQSFTDGDRVPDYAKRAIAAATVGGLAVNYPDIKQLRPNENSTRGEVAALLCQTLGFDDTISERYVFPASWRLAFPPTRGGVEPFNDGLTPVFVDGKYGYLDRDGNFAINPRFDEAKPFSEGLAAVAFREPRIRWKKWGYITPEGQFAIEYGFREAGLFSEGIAPVLDPAAIGSSPSYTAEWRFIDGSGNIVGSTSLSGTIAPFSDGLAKITVNYSQVGYLDREGNTVVEPQYQAGHSFSEGLARVKMNDKWGFIDRTGQVAIALQYEDAGDFSEGLARVQINDKWGFIDKAGEFAIAAQYQNAGDFSEELAAVQIDRKWGFIDRTGQVAIAPQFYSPIVQPPENTPQAAVFAANISPALPFSEGLAAVQVGEKAGFIDPEGNFVIPPIFPRVESFSDGLARVNLNGEWISRGGTFVPQVMVYSDYETVLHGGMWGYIRHPNSF